MTLRSRMEHLAGRLYTLVSNPPNRASAAGIVAAAVAIISLVLCSIALFAQSKPPSQAQSSNSAASSASSKAMLTDAQMSKMSSDELAHYIFEHHGCNNCHTLGTNGKLGFTERGKQVGKGFEGCISLLTSMNVIAQVKPLDRSAEEKEKATRFQEFGCTTCHQIIPGKLGLTGYGSKLKSLHMACTDVERTLSSQR